MKIVIEVTESEKIRWIKIAKEQKLSYRQLIHKYILAHSFEKKLIDEATLNQIQELYLYGNTARQISNALEISLVRTKSTINKINKIQGNYKIKIIHLKNLINKTNNIKIKKIYKDRLNKYYLQKE